MANTAANDDPSSYDIDRLESQPTQFNGNVLSADSTHRTQRSGNLSRSPKQYFTSPDFAELVIYAVLAVVINLVVDRTEFLYNRPIPYQVAPPDADNFVILNLDLNNAYVDSTFPTSVLYVIVALTYFAQFMLSITVGFNRDGHLTTCVYVVALGLTSVTTEGMKKYAGYLRPHFYQVCNLSSYVSAGTPLQCTEESSDIRKSFPSGHASFAFCALTLFTIYLRQRFGVSNRISCYTVSANHGNDATASHNDDGTTMVKYAIRKPTWKSRTVSILCLLPMFLAYMIAGSRVRDNYHHPADVIGGALIGFGFAVYCHGVWFPSVLPA